MTSAPDPYGDAGGQEPEPVASRRPMLWWDIAVPAVLVLLAGFAGVLSEPGTARDALWLCAPAAALGLWYAVAGRAMVRRGVDDQPVRRIDIVTLVFLVVLVGAAVAEEPTYASVQAIGYPIIWTRVARYRDAVLWSLALALAVGVGFLGSIAHEATASGVLEIVAIVVLSFVFALAMGTWITRIFARGEGYRRLLTQLRQSQSEVTALHEEAGAAAERERLSRELHDTLTQTLVGMVMLGEQAQRAIDTGDVARAQDRVARVNAAAREAVTEARALVATTQPLGDGGLEDAIERVADRLRADTGLTVTCALRGDGSTVGREREVVLLRAVQEGLANARKHAGASHVRITLERAAATAALTIEDDGRGPRPIEPGGFGLSGLADRVRAVGGTVAFGPADGPHDAPGARLEVRLERCVPEAAEDDRSDADGASGERIDA